MKTIKDAVIQFKAQWPKGATHLLATGTAWTAVDPADKFGDNPAYFDGERYASVHEPGLTYLIGSNAWQVLCDRQQFEAALWDGAPDWAVDIRVSSMGFLWWTDGKGLVESIKDGSGGDPGWLNELKVVATRTIPAGTDINDLKSATYTVPAPSHDWYDYKTQQMLSVPPAGTVVQALNVAWVGEYTVIGDNPFRPNEAVMVTGAGVPFSTSNIRPLDWDREFRPLIDAAVNVIRTCPSKQAETLAEALYDAGLLR